MAPPSLVNDSRTKSEVSRLPQTQTSALQDPVKQLAVHTGAFNIFSHRLKPLLTIAGVESSILQAKDASLVLYLLVPAIVAGIALISLVYVLVSSNRNETNSTEQRASVYNSENLANQEIFLHDNALFSSKSAYSSSSPPTPVLEERSGTGNATKKDVEDEEITLQTPPRLPEPSSQSRMVLPQEDSPSPSSSSPVEYTTQHTRLDGENSPSILSLGPRASLKLPSAHSPSARAPTHKIQIFTTSGEGDKTIENDAFVLGEDSDVYKQIDNTGIWESAPIRIEPTPATVLAVAGEDDPTESLKRDLTGGESLEKKKTPHYNLDDLKKELKATQEMIASLEIKKI